MPLVQLLAEEYSTLLKAQRGSAPQLDAEKNVVVTVGASQALFAAMQAFVSPGDEVVVIEPAFDIYAAQVRLAGGTVVPVPLKPHSSCGADAEVDPSGGPGRKAACRFTLDPADLRAAMGPRTAVVMLNTPHNPTGKMFTPAELEGIAAVVREHPHAVVVVDEVYEHHILRRDRVQAPGCAASTADSPTPSAASLSTTPQPDFVPDASGIPQVHHCRLAALPGMWERTLTVSSAGKSLVATGWKVGWAYGDAPLISRIQALNQWIHFCVSTPAQAAAATALAAARQTYDPDEDGDAIPDTWSGGTPTHLAHDEAALGPYTYMHHIRAQYEFKRQLLCDALRAGGICPVLPDGGIFVMGDISRLGTPDTYFSPPSPANPGGMTADWAACRFLAHEAGVVAIPPSAFHSPATAHASKAYARFSFAKDNSQLQEAHRRLAAFAVGRGGGDATRD